MVSINGVRCPICKERLTGDNSGELNERLRMHMADLHQMKELSTPSREGAGMQQASFTGPETRAERQVTTFSGVSESDLDPQASAQRQAVTQFREVRRPETPEVREATKFERDKPYEESRLREEATRWDPTYGPQSRTERQVETFSGKDTRSESEAQRLKGEEVKEWKYPRTGPEGERGAAFSEARHGGGMGHRLMSYRKEMTMMLSCPICGNAVYGSDDEDLSDELRFHFRDEHDIRRQRY